MLMHRPEVEAILEDKLFEKNPVSVEVDPANQCNDACGFCAYTDRRAANNVQLPRDTLMQLVIDVGERGVKGMLFTGGGEPLVNPATPEAMARAKEYGIRVGLITNAGLLHEGNLETVVKSALFVRVSLDAGTRKTHRVMHAPKKGETRNEFEYRLDRIRDMRTIRDKINPDMTIGIGFLINQLTMNEIYFGCRVAHESGADYISFRPVYDLPPKEQTVVKEQALPLIESQVGTFMDHFGDKTNLKIHVNDLRFEDLYDEHKDYDLCRSHPLIGVVGATGELYLCCQHKGTEAFSYGKITEERGFFDIWEDKIVRSGVADTIQLGKCPPCKYDTMNRLLTTMRGEGSEERDAHFRNLDKESIQHPNNL